MLLRGGRRAAELDPEVGVWAGGEGVGDIIESSADCMVDGVTNVWRSDLWVEYVRRVEGAGKLGTVDYQWS